jgi:hypothetical protein
LALVVQAKRMDQILFLVQLRLLEEGRVLKAGLLRVQGQMLELVVLEVVVAQ